MIQTYCVLSRLAYLNESTRIKLGEHGHVVEDLTLPPAMLLSCTYERLTLQHVDLCALVSLGKASSGPDDLDSEKPRLSAP